jgi:hypothetical protein
LFDRRVSLAVTVSGGQLLVSLGDRTITMTMREHRLARGELARSDS